MATTVTHKRKCPIYVLNVIAEGVKTDVQLFLLKNRDCITYQGSTFSKAVSIEEFEALFEPP